MSTIRHLSLLACVVAFGLLLAAPAVSEVKTFENSISRAVQGTNNEKIRVCDGQRDSNPAASDYQRYGRDNLQQIVDANGGSNGDCTNRREEPGIYLHNTCELRGFDRVCTRRYSYH